MDFLVAFVWFFLSVAVFYGGGVLDKRYGYNTVWETLSTFGLWSLAFATMYAMLVYWPIIILFMAIGFLYGFLCLVWALLTDR